MYRGIIHAAFAILVFEIIAIGKFLSIDTTTRFLVGGVAVSSWFVLVVAHWKRVKKKKVRAPNRSNN